MPNRKPLFAIILFSAALAACATVPLDPALLQPARIAISEAEAVDADRHAPGPLGAARERLELARAELENRRGQAAKRLADEAEMDARVALARARAAQAEATLKARAEALESLERSLRAEFGDALEEG